MGHDGRVVGLAVLAVVQILAHHSGRVQHVLVGGVRRGKHAHAEGRGALVEPLRERRRESADSGSTEGGGCGADAVWANAVTDSSARAARREGMLDVIREPACSRKPGKPESS